MTGIVITQHARKRLRDDRQQDITISDIMSAAALIPGRVIGATRFRGFTARSGRVFDLVIKDVANGRLVITVIGK